MATSRPTATSSFTLLPSPRGRGRRAAGAAGGLRTPGARPAPRPASGPTSPHGEARSTPRPRPRSGVMTVDSGAAAHPAVRGRLPLRRAADPLRRHRLPRGGRRGSAPPPLHDRRRRRPRAVPAAGIHHPRLPPAPPRHRRRAPHGRLRLYRAGLPPSGVGAVGEFLQAGIESLGRTDRITADADVLALAIDSRRLSTGSTQPDDAASAIWAAVLGGDRCARHRAVSGSGGWRAPSATRRGSRRRSRGSRAASRPRRPPMPASSRRSTAPTMRRRTGSSRTCSTIAGIRSVGGRSAGEIADRFLEQSSLAAGAGLDDRARAVIDRFLAVSGAPQRRSPRCATLRRRRGSSPSIAVLDSFEKRSSGLARRGIDLGRLAFSSAFGRRLDYYTGFVFEIHDPTACRASRSSAAAATTGC